MEQTARQRVEEAVSTFNSILEEQKLSGREETLKKITFGWQSCTKNMANRMKKIIEEEYTYLFGRAGMITDALNRSMAAMKTY